MQAPHATVEEICLPPFVLCLINGLVILHQPHFLGGLIILCQTKIPSPTMHFCIVEVMQSLVQLGALGIPKIPRLRHS